MLWLVLVGTALLSSQECSASGIVPQLMSNGRTESVTNSNFKLSDINVLFESHQQPYQTLISTTGYSSNQAQDEYQPQLHQIDNQPSASYDEINFLFDQPDNLFSLRKVTHQFLPMLWEDARDTVTLQNAALLGVALGGALAIRSNLDDDVRRYTARSPNRWGNATTSLGILGGAEVQIPALLLLYSYSKYQKKDHLHEMSVSLISAYTITGLSTIAIKGIANTERPSDNWNDGQFGFPSFHASNSFAMAAVIDEYYGPRAGIPAYALAGLIGWSRIDERAHDLSDVVFGAALGYVIGKSIAGKHRFGNSNVQIMPYFHPTDGTSGILFELPF